MHTHTHIMSIISVIRGRNLLRFYEERGFFSDMVKYRQHINLEKKIANRHTWCDLDFIKKIVCTCVQVSICSCILKKLKSPTWKVSLSGRQSMVRLFSPSLIFLFIVLLFSKASIVNINYFATKVTLLKGKD